MEWKVGCLAKAPDTRCKVAAMTLASGELAFSKGSFHAPQRSILGILFS